jgi:hypothetical protein
MFFIEGTHSITNHFHLSLKNYDAQYFNMPYDIKDSLIAPIIEIGKRSGYQVIENYDLGAGPIDVIWLFKPGTPEIAPLPDLRIGFVCITEYSEVAINLAIARSMFNLIDKLIIVVPSESITKQISDSIHNEQRTGLVQLRKLVTVLTPSTLVGKTDIEGSRNKDNSITEESSELEAV